MKNGMGNRTVFQKARFFSNTFSGKLRWPVLQTHRQKSFLNRRYKAGKNVHTLNKAKNAEKRSAEQNGKAEEN